MTDLVALKQAVEDARLEYQGIGYANTVGRTAAELVSLDIAYRRAEQKYLNATAKYEAALKLEVER